MKKLFLTALAISILTTTTYAEDSAPKQTLNHAATANTETASKSVPKAGTENSSKSATIVKATQVQMPSRVNFKVTNNASNTSCSTNYYNGIYFFECETDYAAQGIENLLANSNLSLINKHFVFQYDRKDYTENKQCANNNQVIAALNNYKPTDFGDRQSKNFLLSVLKSNEGIICRFPAGLNVFWLPRKHTHTATTEVANVRSEKDAINTIEISSPHTPSKVSFKVDSATCFASGFSPDYSLGTYSISCSLPFSAMDMNNFLIKADLKTKKTTLGNKDVSTIQMCADTNQAMTTLQKFVPTTQGDSLAKAYILEALKSHNGFLCSSPKGFSLWDFN